MCDEASRQQAGEEKIPFLMEEETATNNEEEIEEEHPVDPCPDSTRAELTEDEVIEYEEQGEGSTTSCTDPNGEESTNNDTHSAGRCSPSLGSTSATSPAPQPASTTIQLQSPLLNPPVTQSAAAPPVIPPPKVTKYCMKHPNIEVTLDGKELWDKFYKKGTEMIVNRSGRRMFPGFSVSISGLKPKSKYSMKLDVVLADNHRFKFLNARWLAVGSSEPQAPYETYLHPDSPNTGSFWMRHGVSFRKLKITNNKDKPGQNALLHSMHKYYVRLLIEEERKTIPGEVRALPKPIMSIEFQETTFIAVTAYQNEEVTQLKISNNPFAKAFRENTTEMDWETAQALYHSPGYMQGQGGGYYSSAWGMQSPSLLSPAPQALTPTMQHHHTYQPPQHFPPHHQIQLHHQALTAGSSSGTPPQGMQYSPDSPMLSKPHHSGSGGAYFHFPPTIKTETSSSSPCYQQTQTIYGPGVATTRPTEGSPTGAIGVYHHVQYTTAPPTAQQLPDFDSVFTSPPGSMHNVYNEQS